MPVDWEQLSRSFMDGIDRKPRPPSPEEERWLADRREQERREMERDAYIRACQSYEQHCKSRAQQVAKRGRPQEAEVWQAAAEYDRSHPEQAAAVETETAKPDPPRPEPARPEPSPEPSAAYIAAPGDFVQRGDININLPN